MVFDTADVAFLAQGKFALRYISARPDLVAKHARPEGTEGDGYCLSNLAVLLPKEDQKHREPLVNILNNLDKLPPLLEKAVGKIIDRALRESPDDGGSLVFLLLKDMTSTGYDVHPEHCPMGKGGRRTIKPEQIVSTIQLNDLEVLGGQISAELGDGPTAKDMLFEKITGGIRQMRLDADAPKPRPAVAPQKTAAP